ncbi:MAG: ankyrin repeat protein, partial [Candidatus Marinamargulisbacteria bacterium]
MLKFFKTVSVKVESSLALTPFRVELESLFEPNANTMAIFDCLLEHGSNADFVAAIQELGSDGVPYFFKFLVYDRLFHQIDKLDIDFGIRDKAGNTFFHDLMAKSDRKYLATILVRFPTLINVKNDAGYSPIEVLVTSRQPDTIRYLMKCLKIEIPRFLYTNGWSLGHVAACNGDFEMFQKLVEGGAAQEFSRDGQSALHIA